MQQHDRILIVDDHPTNVALLEDILADDYQLATASSGDEALAIAPDFQPSLVLLDIMMPGLNGYETCRRLRAHPTLHHSKIIMVSAKALVSERIQGYEAGADDYITKPFDEDELLAKVRVYLRLKSVEEVDRLKSDLLLLLGHETRTPLNGIIPPLEMLLSEEDLDAQERRLFLTMAYQSAERLQRLFERVLKLSRLKAGQWDFQFTPTDLGELVQDATKTVAATAALRHVQVDLERADAAVASLDQAQIFEVITAILDNAIRFSPFDGRVAVRVAVADDAAVLTVGDSGEGIDPDFLPRMFEEFAQPNLTHHTEGLGLSLALARQIVLAHNGRLDVTSTKGLGTTLTVRLPVAVPAPHLCETF